MGQSLDVKARFMSHRSPKNLVVGKGKCRRLYSAVRKYGWDAMRFQVLLERVPEPVLDEAERFFVSKHSTLSPGGYNLTTGGDAGRHEAPEVLEKKRIATKASWQDPNIRGARVRAMGEGIKAGWGRLDRAGWLARTQKNRDYLQSEEGYNARCSIHGRECVSEAKRETWAAKRRAKIMALPPGKRRYAWRQAYQAATRRVERMGGVHVQRVADSFEEEIKGWAAAYIE